MQSPRYSEGDEVRQPLLLIFTKCNYTFITSNIVLIINITEEIQKTNNCI